MGNHRIQSGFFGEFWDSRDETKMLKMNCWVVSVEEEGDEREWPLGLPLFTEVFEPIDY